MSRLSDGWLDEFGYLIMETSTGGQYETSDAYGIYKPIITLHLTATADFSREAIARHGSPPHVWAHYGRNELTQTVNLKKSAKALYQQQFGEAWTNRHFLNLQVEWVKLAAYEPTASDAELRWLAEKVVVPFILFIRSQGYDIDIRSEPTVPMGGAASEFWSFRYTEREVALCNWIIDHSRWPHQDHWDVCAEDKIKICLYAAADPRLSGIVVPPLPILLSGDDMSMLQFISDPSQGGDGTLYFAKADGTAMWPVRSDETRVMAERLGFAYPVTNGESTKLPDGRQIPFKLQPYWIRRFCPEGTPKFEDR